MCGSDSVCNGCIHGQGLRAWNTILASVNSVNVQSDKHNSDYDEGSADFAENPSSDLVACIAQEESAECLVDIEADIEVLQAGQMGNFDKHQHKVFKDPFLHSFKRLK